MTELNEYIISEIVSCAVYTKVWAKSYEDALEVKCGSAPGYPDNIYEVPEPVLIRHEYWNGGDDPHLIAVNGVYMNGYAHMEDYLK